MEIGDWRLEDGGWKMEGIVHGLIGQIEMVVHEENTARHPKAV